jgi:hypothetical protein
MVDTKRSSSSSIEQARDEITGQSPSHDRIGVFSKDELNKLPHHQVSDKSSASSSFSSPSTLSASEIQHMSNEEKDKKEHELTDYLQYNPSPS